MNPLKVHDRYMGGALLILASPDKKPNSLECEIIGAPRRECSRSMQAKMDHATLLGGSHELGR